MTGDPSSCLHAARTLTWPGGEAVQSPNGNWSQYLPGNVVRHTQCPVCGLHLPSEVAGDSPRRNIPSAVFSESYIKRHQVKS